MGTEMSAKSGMGWFHIPGRQHTSEALMVEDTGINGDRLVSVGYLLVHGTACMS
jgi:hypothetical protein